MKIQKVMAMAIYALLINNFLGCQEVKDPPDTQTIQKWMKGKDKLLPVDNVIPVYLESHEKAYLAPVMFKDRGRNFMFRGLLIRPRHKEAREVGELGHEISVMDLDNNGVSEVITRTVGSGQGTERGEKAILNFRGWVPIVLYKTEFFDRTGAGYDNFNEGEIFEKAVNWDFADMNMDNVLDLRETVTVWKLRNNLFVNETKINKLYFVDGKFILSE